MVWNNPLSYSLIVKDVEYVHILFNVKLHEKKKKGFGWEVAINPVLAIELSINNQ